MMLEYWCIILLVGNLGLYAIQRYDKQEWMLQRMERRIIIAGSGMNAVIIAQLCFVDGTAKFLLAILAGCLLLACITDCQTCEVYQFTWWIAGGAGVLFWLRYLGNVNSVDWVEVWLLLLYCALQELFFCKFYGRADCHAFVVCALFFGGMGMQIVNCLTHMLLAFGGLAIVQLARHNVNKKGNLKQPVAFLPYITTAFWINLCCFSLEKMVY